MQRAPGVRASEVASSEQRGMGNEVQRRQTGSAALVKVCCLVFVGEGPGGGESRTRSMCLFEV